MTDKPLAGRTALVTGAARNIGRATALRLSRMGAAVAVNALQDEDAASAVCEEIREAGGTAHLAMADVTDAAAARAMAAEAAEALGPITVLVLNASARGQVPFLEMSHADWRRVIDISLDGSFHLAQACLPAMIEAGWGRIVTLGGISWHVGFRNRANNLTAKAGLTGFTRALAAEFAGAGVTANMVAPGPVGTARPASAGALPPVDNPPPVPRKADVEEIASAVTFLCHPEQGFVTGQVLHVNGGMHFGA